MSSPMTSLAAGATARAAWAWRAVAVGHVAVTAHGAAAVVARVTAKAVRTESTAAKTAALTLMHREFGNRARRRHVVLGLRQRRADQGTMADPGAGRLAIRAVRDISLGCRRGGGVDRVCRCGCAGDRTD